MRKYFTVMIKEGDASNLKLLTEKLNEGFSVDNHITAGRSTVITLCKHEFDTALNGVELSMPTALSYRERG